MIADAEDGQAAADEATASLGHWDVRETRIRQARKVVRELKRVADEKGMTMNALITNYIHSGLKADGRRGVDELAPWFNDYLRRKGGPAAAADRPADTDEEFT